MLVSTVIANDVIFSVFKTEKAGSASKILVAVFSYLETSIGHSIASIARIWVEVTKAIRDELIRVILENDIRTRSVTMDHIKFVFQQDRDLYTSTVQDALK